MSKFSARLREARKEKNLTQKQLADAIHVSEDCIYSWEKGRSEPSINDLISLSNLFNLSVDFLIGRIDIF